MSQRFENCLERSLYQSLSLPRHTNTSLMWTSCPRIWRSLCMPNLTLHVQTWSLSYLWLTDSRSRVDQRSLHQFLLAYALLYLFPLLLSVNLLSPEEDESWKALVCYCFPVFRFIGEYVFLDLFHLVVDMNYQHCSTLSSFKAKLKTFLFSQYFHPN